MQIRLRGRDGSGVAGCAIGGGESTPWLLSRVGLVLIPLLTAASVATSMPLQLEAPQKGAISISGLGVRSSRAGRVSAIDGVPRSLAALVALVAKGFDLGEGASLRLANGRKAEQLRRRRRFSRSSSAKLSGGGGGGGSGCLGGGACSTRSRSSEVRVTICSGSVDAVSSQSRGWGAYLQDGGEWRGRPMDQLQRGGRLKAGAKAVGRRTHPRRLTG